MVSIYVTEAKAQLILWTQIPKLWREPACAQLVKEGYILDPDGHVYPFIDPKANPVNEEPTEI